MMACDDSWLFLREFFLRDKSIANYINMAIGIKSKRKIKDTNEHVFLNDIISLLPNNNDGTTYLDFLKYVCPDCDPEITNVERIENSFLNHLWINISSNSNVIRYMPEHFREKKESAGYLPYILLRSFGIDIDWLLYGGESAFFFVDKKEHLGKFFSLLKQGYESWQGWLHFDLNPKNIWSRCFWRKQLSVEQLYPLMVLLIVLRREWNESCHVSYIKKKIESLSGKEGAGSAIIYSIYDKYSDGDEEIRSIYAKEEYQRINFHELVVEHIIKSGSYKYIYDSEYSPVGAISGEEKEKWIEIEKIYRNESGKRLLVDYYFPYTTVREDYVFIPDDFLVNRIYVSLEKGKDYKQNWRNVQDDERFDYIQIYPMTNSSFEISDYRTVKYKKHLTPKGDFIVVEDELDAKKRKAVKEALSNFRHDLKDLMNDADIKNLRRVLAEAGELSNLFKDLFIALTALLSHKDAEESSLPQVRKILKDLDVNSVNSKKYPQLSRIVAQTRDKIEDYIDTEDKGLLSQIDIDEIKLHYYQTYERIFSEISVIGDCIERRHEILCSRIKTVGTSLDVKQEKIAVHEFLSGYIKILDLNKKRVNISADLSGIDRNLVISYNRATLHVILNTIIDNAIKHGFSNYECENPMIKLIAEIKGDYLLLNICNNGSPITISNEEYKTRGVFKGETGHTGIGGYQISRYAELQGGYVEIPKIKKWNTEIHLYIKK